MAHREQRASDSSKISDPPVALGLDDDALGGRATRELRDDGLAGLLPFVVFSPMGGVLADRVDRRRLLMRTDALAVLTNLALAIVILAGIP